MLTILIENSIKFTFTGGIKIHLNNSETYGQNYI